MSLTETEFAVLRTTIATRGTVRMALLPVTVVSWGLLAAVLALWSETPIAVVFPLAQCLDEINRRTPLPPLTCLEQTLKVAMQQMSRLEADHLDVGQTRQLLPQTRPQALAFDADAREVADFVRDLRLISKIRDQDDVARADEQQRAGSRKPREITDVRKARDE